MKWGNSYFLKKIYDGRQWKKADFTSAQKTLIDETYNIGGTLPKGGVVERINSISWNAKYSDDGMHLQYYGGGSIIRWNEIE